MDLLTLTLIATQDPNRMLADTTERFGMVDHWPIHAKCAVRLMHGTGPLSQFHRCNLFTEGPAIHGRPCHVCALF